MGTLTIGLQFKIFAFEDTFIFIIVLRLPFPILLVSMAIGTSKNAYTEAEICI